MMTSKCFILITIILLQGCNYYDSDIEGTWSMKSTELEEPLPSIFSPLFLKVVPYEYIEKIYLEDGLIEYPLGFTNTGNVLEDNFIEYEVKGNEILLPGYHVILDRKAERICINSTCFQKSDENESEKIVEYFDLKIKNDGELSLGCAINDLGVLEVYHSNLRTISKIELEKTLFDYVKKLGGRIKLHESVTEYNLTTFDERKYELLMVINGAKYIISTYGLDGDTPFEVKALILNLIKIVEQNN